MATPHHNGNAQRIARKINHLIQETGVTKAHVHRAAGIARNTFYDKLNSRPGSFTVEELDGIAETFGLTLSELLAA